MWASELEVRISSISNRGVKKSQVGKQLSKMAAGLLARWIKFSFRTEQASGGSSTFSVSLVSLAVLSWHEHADRSFRDFHYSVVFLNLLIVLFKLLILSRRKRRSMRQNSEMHWKHLCTCSGGENKGRQWVRWNLGWGSAAVLTTSRLTYPEHAERLCFGLLASSHV